MYSITQKKKKKFYMLGKGAVFYIAEKSSFSVMYDATLYVKESNE